MAPRDRGRTTTDDTVIALRDRLSHRGPDDAGLWSNPRAAIGHRRLAVLDPTPAGRQPMVGAADPATGDPRYVLAYNGELYNDLDLRADLASMGVRFETSCDTETVLAALIAWGADALPKLRGMFAIAFYDAREHELLLARDPLGVKPLYYASTTVGPPELLFASEPTPILEHPRFTPSPNLAMVSAYLTTIRTVLGDQTMFDGVHAVRPGEAVRIRFDHAPRIESRPFWTGERAHDDGLFETSIDRTRDAVTASLIAHLRADVPTCSLLSGGLDSTILSTLAADHHPDLRTYCAGARARGESDAETDLDFADRAAAAIGSSHASEVIDEDHFAQWWPRMVGDQGVPLSTPNEVAIRAVAGRLRADGCVVTISGEGADELFGGYDLPLRAAAASMAMDPSGSTGGARFLASASWLPVAHKAQALRPEVYSAVDHDSWLVAFAQHEFDLAAGEAGDPGLGAFLRMQRRWNLTGLLQRLDTATMACSVEGRTPFADARIAELAESLPIDHKIVLGDESAGGGVATATMTKRVLREAFRDRVAAEVADRPKASFPLPFQRWMGAHAGAVRHCGLCEATFRREAIDLVATDPEHAWAVAWPMTNLALWGERWWGRSAG